jgi:hypothetical protein
VLYQVIEKVKELNGIGPAKGGQMDRHELMEFLKGANIHLTENNFNPTNVVDTPYQANIDAYVDGRWNDIEGHLPDNKANAERIDQ